MGICSEQARPFAVKLDHSLTTPHDSNLVSACHGSNSTAPQHFKGDRSLDDVRLDKKGAKEYTAGLHGGRQLVR